MVAGRTSFVVDENESGQRLERVVKRRFQLSTVETRKLFAAKGVTLEGVYAAKGQRVQAGNVVVLQAPPERRVLPNPGLALDVKHETESLIVLEKPAGQPCHVLLAEETDTLVNALVSRYPELSAVGHSWREPGLVHRLDTFTSGLVLAARSESAFQTLRDALKRGDVVKRYLAFVARDQLPRELPLGVDAALRPAGAKGRRVAVHAEGHPAHSWLMGATACHETPWAILEVEARHAYRHQIRAHLAHLGCPIVGDVLYGGVRLDSLMRGDASRHALHASYVAWAGNEHVPGFRVSSELPRDLLTLAAGKDD